RERGTEKSRHRKRFGVAARVLYACDDLRPRQHRSHMRARTSDRTPPNRNLHERVAGLCHGGNHTMTQHDRAPAQPNSGAVHFPGNLRWTTAMQIVRGMVPYGAVAMDEVERVGRRLKARAAETDLDQVWREEWAAMAECVAAVADPAAAERRHITAGHH